MVETEGVHGVELRQKGEAKGAEEKVMQEVSTQVASEIKKKMQERVNIQAAVPAVVSKSKFDTMLVSIPEEHKSSGQHSDNPAQPDRVEV